MLFQSQFYVLVFLPVAAALYYSVANWTIGRQWVLIGLSLISMAGGTSVLSHCRLHKLQRPGCWHVFTRECRAAYRSSLAWFSTCFRWGHSSTWIFCWPRLRQRAE